MAPPLHERSCSKSGAAFDVGPIGEFQTKLNTAVTNDASILMPTFTPSTWDVDAANAVFGTGQDVVLAPGSYALGTTSLDLNGRALVGLGRPEITYSGTAQAVLVGGDAEVRNIELRAIGGAYHVAKGVVFDGGGSASSIVLRNFGKPIYLEDCQDVRVDRARIIGGNGDGISGNPSNPQNDGIFNDIVMRGQERGIHLVKARHMVFRDIAIEDSDDAAILIACTSAFEVHGVHFDGCRFENNQTDDGSGRGEVEVIANGADASQVSFSGCTWSNIGGEFYILTTIGEEGSIAINDCWPGNLIST